MRRSITALTLFLLFASSAFSKEVFFPIAGSTSALGVFRTDVRLFNPSSSKDITVQAYLLPIGNRDNSSVTSRTVTVPKRQMISLNDVVTALGGSDLNAIRLTSADDFVASERVYAQQTPSGSCNIGGTLGQDVPALDPAGAKKQGVLLQLKTTSGDCRQNGAASFRTNIGVVNPNTTAASATFRLYDKNNALISTGAAITVPPMAVIAPTNMVSGFFFSPGGADLSDAWVGFTSDQPILAYASLVDNCTSDPTFIPMAEDSISTSSKEIYFPTAGSTSSSGAFKTDVRLFNPSSSKDITVQAYLLPIGNKDNSSASPHPVTVPKRQMVVLNDLVTALGGTDLNAIRMTSGDAFVATERVYTAQSTSGSCNVAGTVGEDVQAVDSSNAKKQGLLLQLKTATGSCSQGTPSFRTNIGVVNPNGTVANVTFRLYDKSNALISTGSAIAVPPMGVIGPTNMTGGFFFTAGNADLSDAWVSYTSDQPILAFASLLDTCTSDPMFIPMAEDSGGGTPAPSSKSFSITTHNFAIDWSPTLTTGAIALGDQLILTITGRDQTHGFELDDPDGNAMIVLPGVPPGQTFSRTVTITKEGTYNFFCLVPTCGLGNPGHSNMFGQFIVGTDTGPPPPRY